MQLDRQRFIDRSEIGLASARLNDDIANLEKIFKDGWAPFDPSLVLVQTAEAPDEAPDEELNICSPFGADFYYIPGADTCLKVSGTVQAESRPIPAGASAPPPPAGCTNCRLLDEEIARLQQEYRDWEAKGSAQFLGDIAHQIARLREQKSACQTTCTRSASAPTPQRHVAATSSLAGGTQSSRHATQTSQASPGGGETDKPDLKKKLDQAERAQSAILESMRQTRQNGFAIREEDWRRLEEISDRVDTLREGKDPDAPSENGLAKLFTDEGEDTKVEQPTLPAQEAFGPKSDQAKGTTTPLGGRAAAPAGVQESKIEMPQLPAGEVFKSDRAKEKSKSATKAKGTTAALGGKSGTPAQQQKSNAPTVGQPATPGALEVIGIGSGIGTGFGVPTLGAGSHPATMHMDRRSGANGGKAGMPASSMPNVSGGTKAVPTNRESLVNPKAGTSTIGRTAPSTTGARTTGTGTTGGTTGVGTTLNTKVGTPTITGGGMRGIGGFGF
jgi:hypothetical protein